MNKRQYKKLVKRNALKNASLTAKEMMDLWKTLLEVLKKA